MSAGERIRAARKRKGWTQKDLAAEVGCSQQTVVDIEKSENPQSRFLSAIVRALEEDLDYIETGIGAPAASVDGGSELPHLDMETAALRALDSSYADNAIDSLYQAPVKVSRAAYSVGVDRMTAQLMPDTVRQDDVLFVDPQVELVPGRLVLAVMPGWRRAELRELTSVAGRFYLASEGAEAIPCVPYQSRDDYLAHESGEAEPAMICGTVIFIGREV